jgi:hypothetical protein
MSYISKIDYEPWPELTAADFNKTSHLLFMGIQAIGKLMLNSGLVL